MGEGQLYSRCYLLLPATSLTCISFVIRALSPRRHVQTERRCVPYFGGFNSDYMLFFIHQPRVFIVAILMYPFIVSSDYTTLFSQRSASKTAVSMLTTVTSAAGSIRNNINTKSSNEDIKGGD